MQNKKMILYRTSDIYFSSFLSALDLDLVTTEKEKVNRDRKKVIFVFKVPEEDLGRLKTLFFGGSGTVKGLKYANALKTLKQMCFV